MVRGEAVNHIHVFPQGIHIFLRSEARTHFAAAGMPMRNGGNIILREEQVMRADFAGHFDSAFLGSLDEQNFLF